MAGPILTLYVRQDCHLCAEMHAELERLQARLDFGLRSIDIDEAPELVERYDHKVPVLAHGDYEICYYFLEEAVLLQYLAGTR